MFLRFRFGALFLASLFTLTSCGGGGASRLFPGGGTGNGSGSGAPTGVANGSGNVQVKLIIPSKSTSSTTTASAVRKPATISPDTESITVSVNGGTPQIFNAGPPTCSTTTPVTCALSIGAPAGVDSFLIITWSGANGTGTQLNAAAVTLSVSSSGPNVAAATAGNLLTVNSSADGSGPSFSCTSSSSTCTLREAIAEASTTAGVYTALLFAPSVTTINLSSSNGPITINGQNILILGPGATAANSSGVGAPTASGNLTISGSNAVQLFTLTSGTFFVDGVTLANGNSSSGGGAILNSGASLAIVNTIFSGNSAPAQGGFGGAVWDESNLASTIVASTFTNNTGEEGGAFFENGSGASFNLSLFTNNTAYNSSDGFGEGGAIYTITDLSVNASTFTSNVAGSTTVANTEGSGGAIGVGQQFEPTIAVSNSTFGGTSASSGNFAGGPGPNDDGEGGAIYTDSTVPLTSSGNTFANNVVRGGDEATAGGIAADDGGGITSSNDTFTNNVADASASGATGESTAGALFITGASTLTNDTFSANQALATANGFASAAAMGIDEAPVTVSQTTFNKNTSLGGECNGGAIYAYVDQQQFITLSGVQITSNSCTTNGGSGSVASGGGLEVDYGFVTFQNLTVSGNTADASQASGASYAIGGGFEWLQGDYEGNQCNPDCSKTRRLSPQIANRPKLRLARTALSKSIESHVAKMRARVQSIAARHPSAFSRHGKAGTSVTRVASARRSPQLSVGSGSTMQNTTFSSNTANGGATGTAYGGGADLSGQPTVTAATFSSNTATASGSNAFGAGGGFSLGSYDGQEENTGSVTITGSTISGNSALNEGGGIWNGDSNIFGTYSTVSSNSVTAVANEYDGGGGIWNGDDSNLTAFGFTFNANTVSGSTAMTGGGAVLNYQGFAQIENSTLYKNNASVDGGGVENIFESEVEFINATVYQNSAGNTGGNVNNDPSPAGPGSTTVIAWNTIIAGGTATTSGPDIWNIDTFTSDGYNVVQQGSNYGSGTSNAPQTGDILGQDPLLASGLANNGGPTQTIADTSSSPGRAHIPFSGSCNGAPFTSIDQRIFTRGSGGLCDVGAYELSGTVDTSPPVIRPTAAKRAH